MIYFGKVKGYGKTPGRLDLECAPIAEWNVLPDIPPLHPIGMHGDPLPGDPVLVYALGGNQYRWVPSEPNRLPKWYKQGKRRRGLYDPTRDVAVVLDGDDRSVRIGRYGADKRVVQEDIKTLLTDLWTAAGSIVMAGGALFNTTPAWADGAAKINAIANYTAAAVYVPKDAIAKDGGGA